MTQQVFGAEIGFEVIGVVGNTQILNGSVNPTQGGGVPAPISSTYHLIHASPDEVSIWLKYGPANTDWRRVDLDTYLIVRIKNTDVDALTLIDHVPLQKATHATWKIQALHDGHCFSCTIDASHLGSQVIYNMYGIQTIGNPDPNFVTFNVLHNAGGPGMDLVVTPQHVNTEIRATRLSVLA